MAVLSRKQAGARREYQAARQTMTKAQKQLGAQLRLLYEQDEPDPIAVILGSSSLNDVIDGLDNIRRIAHATESVLDQAKRARVRVQRERRELAAQAARTDAARERVAASEAELERAQSERTAYLAQLRTEQALNTAQIASLEERARQAQVRAQAVAAQAEQERQQGDQQAAPSPETPVDTTAEASGAPPAAAATTSETPAPPPEPAAPGEPPPAPVESVSQSGSTGSTSQAPGPPTAGRTMSVYATAYCLTGTTATGLPVGPGIVAVDPTVIPLGTRMTIPGYGDGVAADTGGAIKGARIDVWIASCSDAGTFNRQVTITFL